MLITNQKELERFCSSLKSAEFITVDTEFLREKTYYPKLCLIQIGGPDGQGVAIDPLEDGIDLDPVYELLYDLDILKVFHAGRQDLEIFYNLTEKVVSPIFDTQVAAMVCGYGDSVGYDNLVKQVTGVQVDKSSQYTNWSHRPLSRKQIDYAIGDVTHLIDVYRSLVEDLDKRGRTDWVFQEEEILNDPATYENDPYKAWERVKIRGAKPKTLAILRELAAWREKKAQDRDIPKPWVMRDETLADLAGQAPDHVKKLAKIRNMPKEVAKEDSRTGTVLIELIDKALKSDPLSWPAATKKRPLSIEAATRAEILNMLLKIKAAEAGVAARLIATKDDLQKLAADHTSDNLILKGWRREIFGEDALKVLSGNLAIGLKDNKIAKFNVGENEDSD